MSRAAPIRRLRREELVRRSAWHAEETPRWEPLLGREWLVTNGLGGYASGTVAGAGTRRYHGYLIASLPAPLGRVLTLARLGETLVREDGKRARLEGEERAGGVRFDGIDRLVEFRLEWGLPVWTYRVGRTLFEKRVFMPYERNAVHVRYRYLEGKRPLRLELRPYLHGRPHEAPVDTPLPRPFTLTGREDEYAIGFGAPELPPLRLWVEGGAPALLLRPAVVSELVHRVEAHRGYAPRGALWTPGTLRVRMAPGADVCLVATVDPGERAGALDSARLLEAELERRRDLVRRLPARAASAAPVTPERAELALAADQFLVTPAWRYRAPGGERLSPSEPRSVVAGYHWFTDWGRDTMISLEGLTLLTGRHEEARRILRSFCQHVREGLIPNLFPEHDGIGLYHTADATLWMFHALSRYLAHTGDRETVHVLLPTLRDIVARHLAGTRFGIGVDPSDGLLRQGEPGYQLTWMDAKVDDWVVTPRRGKAVEINALWYNALRCLEGWLEAEGDGEAARAIAEHAERARRAFNRRFWFPEGGYLFDVVDGEAVEGDGSGRDAACRPNQILAISLPHPVLDEARWEAVFEAVRERLLTPYGLRTLAPGHRDYRPEYFGDLRARDAAYHQGTVWPWLLGPFIDAWLRVHPEQARSARAALASLLSHLDEAGIGTVSEIFDGEPPHAPRGCIAQAWSVAELLRSLERTAAAAGRPGGDRAPAGSAAE